MTDPQGPQTSDSLVEAALKVLNQPDPWKKAEYSREAVRLWREGLIRPVPAHSKPLVVPDRPARSDDKVKVVGPADVPKRGRGGTLASRCAIVHSLCHIESWAVDLSWDAIARYGITYADIMPIGFYNDFVGVADDECRHFLLLEQRLKELGSYYGAMPAHDGLWESASRSAISLAARLAVEHCVHEARGLDVMPATIQKFKSAGDKETAELLEKTIYPEEVGHCAAGVRWLTHLHAYAAGRATGSPVSGSYRKPQNASESQDCTTSSSHAAATQEGKGSENEGVEGGMAGLSVSDRSQQPDGAANGHCGRSAESGLDWEAEARQFPTVQTWFHSLVRTYFAGSLKPPFNTDARTRAGFDPSWYEPLAKEAVAKKGTAATQKQEEEDEH